MARELVQGVDLWLNTPRRGEEACGTSGMKAGVNGVLNLSILDGWFDEGYEISGGWAIGDREPYSDDQDEIHARAIYSILENEIVPMYYQDREGGVPVEWMRRVKQSLMHLSHQFNSGRMVGEYLSQLYEPAHQAYLEVSHDCFQPARDRAGWNQRVREVWEKVGFVEIGPGPGCVRAHRASDSGAGGGESGRAFAQRCARGSGDRPHRRERESRGNSGDDASGGGASRQRICVLKRVRAASNRQARVFSAN